MKKKIINGLLFAVALVAATSSFVSCKDYEGDNYAELQEKYSTLEEAYLAQVQAMKDYVLTSRYNDETGYSPELLVSKGTIAKRLEELEKDTASLAERIAKNSLAIAQAKALWAKLVPCSYWGDDLNAAVDKAAEVLVTVAQDSAKWNEAYDSIAKNAQSWNDVRDYVLAHQDKWNEAYDSIAKRSKEWNRAVEVADSAYNFIHNNYKGEFKNLQELIDAYKAADEALQEQIDDLKADVEKILKALRTEITGITVQAAVNPIFGSFAYPVDVQSNVLAAYYGEVTDAGDDGYVFPAGDEFTDIWASGTAAILRSELDDIEPKNVYTVKDGILMNEGAGNAGKLYVTVNPSNVDFDGKYFTLRTSDNQVSKVSLSALEPCTEQLKWGYQRASANGFYVANAEIKKDEVKDVALSFNMKGSELAATVQGMMSDWSKTGIADVAKLAYTVVNGMKADVPRLGVQAQWQDAVTGDWKNYVSKYDLAAFSVNPLGFDFLNGADYSEGIIKLKNQITAKEKAFSQEVINMIANAVKVEIGLPENVSGSSIKVTNDNRVILVIPSVHFETLPESFPVNVAGSYGTVTVTKLEGNTDTAEADITSLFNAIKNGIEGSLSGINGTVDKEVKKILNKIISVEHKFFDKVASVAKNPNRFLQPALIAQSDALGYFYPSRIYFAPTQVKKGTKLMLYPTTLSGETVVPAFKKYVAVCGAWDVKDMNKTTSAKKFNTEGTAMNTVFDGSEYDLQKPFEYVVDAPAGTVLEIIYECLDYTGKVAGKKYYIEVY